MSKEFKKRIKKRLDFDKNVDSWLDEVEKTQDVSLVHTKKKKLSIGVRINMNKFNYRSNYKEGISAKKLAKVERRTGS